MRKIFFTSMPGGGVDEITAGEYKIPEGSSLKPCGKVAYPVTMTMENMIQDKENEEYAVVMLGPKGNKASQHKAGLDRELESRGFKCKTTVVHYTKKANDQLGAESSIKQLIGAVKNGDEIYVNIEFGANPILFAMLFSIMIVDNALKDVSVEGVFYGEKQFEIKDKKTGKVVRPEDYIFWDVSYLYYIGKLAGEIPSADEEDVLKNVEMLLSLGK